MKKLNSYPFSQLYKMSSGVSTVPEQAGHGAPFVSFSTIFNNPVMPEELPDLMDTSVEEQEKCSVKKGDILITRTSETKDELAMSSVALKDYPHATFSGFAKRLRPLQRDITYDKFMAYYLRSPYFRKVVDAKVIMTLRASFNEKIFSYIDLELPEYDEQVVIGDFFYTIEEKIRTNNKIVCEIRKLLTLFYDYWFTQFDFPNEEGKPYRQSGGEMVHNDDLDRDIPVGWEVVDVESLLSKVPKTKKYQSSEFSSQGKYPIIDQSEDYICGYTDVEEDLIQENSAIVFGDHSKRLKYVNFPFARGADGTQIIISNNDRLPNILLYMQLLKKPLHGPSYARHFKMLKQQKVFIPDNEATAAFVSIATPCWELIREITRENYQLAQLRNYLLPLLMSGQVSITGQTTDIKES